jgi:hypothetical protein
MYQRIEARKGNRRIEEIKGRKGSQGSQGSQ